MHTSAFDPLHEITLHGSRFRTLITLHEIKSY